MEAVQKYIKTDELFPRRTLHFRRAMREHMGLLKRLVAQTRLVLTDSQLLVTVLILRRLGLTTSYLGRAA